jgi:hypothetical protein
MQKYKEYKFKIEAYTPDTLPMARCASYLAELATILGETASVHFVRVASGCAQLVHRVDLEAEPKVKEHARAVANGTGTDNQMRAYRRVNRMLLEDNGTGSLVQGKAKILQFPGKKEEFLNFSSVQQQGEIDGEVIRVGGSKDIVPILLEVEGREISGCHAKRNIAKDLAKNLFEPVRLFGEGKWDRNVDGEWKLIEFTVDRFDVLEESALSKTVIALRGLKGDWGKDSFCELLESRNYEDKH